MPLGGLREPVLGLATLCEDALESLVVTTAILGRRGHPLVHLGQPALDPLELGGGEPRLQELDLAGELLRALRGRRLQGQRPQALAHLVLEVARPLRLRLDPRELQLCPVAPPLELPQARGLLDQRAPLVGLGGEDLLDPALPDDRVLLAGEPDVREQLDDVRPAHAGAVDEVLALAAAVQPPHDRELGHVERPVARLVVEEQLDLAPVGRRLVLRARVEHVVGALGAQLGGAQAPRGPDDRVGDVRLARPVRADDHGDARLEAHLDRVRE